MAQLVQQGKVKALEHTTEGIENAGRAFVEMMSGGNTGKAVVKVAAEDPFPVKQ
jgi:NADPH-dependent curcumin reductase CurA